MSEQDRAGLVVLFHGFALGFAFVWVAGFAIGYVGWAGWFAGWSLFIASAVSVAVARWIRG